MHYFFQKQISTFEKKKKKGELIHTFWFFDLVLGLKSL
jgi:hypothetical protein